MYTRLEASVPFSAMVKLPPDALQAVLFALTSKPAGAVTVKFPVIKPAPDILKVVGDDAVPVVVLKADGVPVVEMVGVSVVTPAGLPVPGVVNQATLLPVPLYSTTMAW